MINFSLIVTKLICFYRFITVSNYDRVIFNPDFYLCCGRRLSFITCQFFPAKSVASPPFFGASLRRLNSFEYWNLCNMEQKLIIKNIYILWKYIMKMVWRLVKSIGFIVKIC